MSALRYLSRKLILNNIKCEGCIKINCASTYLVCNRSFSYISKEYCQEKDPAPIFFNREVQDLLKSLTRINLNKVFKKRRSGDKKLDVPVYKFMTEEQLKEAIDASKIKADELLQMPPVLQVRKPISNIINKEPALQGLDTARMVFTDITFGLKNSERLIVVREPDGTLQEAEWTLRDHMNQVYFPINGRELRTPVMFEESYLKNLLNENEYKFILDRACIQYEPNDIEYQKITSITYQFIDENNGYDLLRSTRHFGPLAFFLTWFQMIDNLLIELIETNFIDEAKNLVVLYGSMHNVKFDSKSMDNLDIIERYIKDLSKKKGPLELAMQAYKDLEMERRQLEKGIQVAHGRA